MAGAAAEHVEIAIVGAGFAGLGMAMRLQDEGREDFLVLERDGDVGGTWWANTYPGAACDVPSRLYSYSFAPEADWTRSFSPQPEILDYLRTCADRAGIRPRIRLRCAVHGADWDEDAGLWRLHTARGPLTARVLVAAAGALSEPRLPGIPGIEDFAGTLFHTAAWDHGHDLTGKRVAVIGTGASAVQVVPALQPKVAQLDLYQRTAAWIGPRPDRRFTGLERALYRRVPALARLARGAIYWGREVLVVGFTRDPRVMRVPGQLARRHLRRQVPDPELRRRLTPDYTIGCKRILISNDFYPALQQPNAELVTDPIAEIRPHAVVTRDGTERPVDAIVLATGFQVAPPPVGDMIRGRGGLRLGDVWRERGMRAYRGTTFSGFPNLFMLVGPNTGLGHSSMIYMIESQLAYVLDALRRMGDGTRVTTAVEPRPEALEAYNAAVQRRLARSVWSTGGCSSWYQDQHGQNVTLWPSFTFHFRRLLSRFDLENYEQRPVPAGAGAGAGAPLGAAR
jgi:cation diffusion facilitator CzcD-associated flavoprotein CzcO